MMAVVEPEINGTLFTTIGAKMVSYKVGGCDYSNGYLLAPASMIPVKLAQTVGLRSITMTFDFEGDTPREIAVNISKVTALMQEMPDILLPDGFHYYCAYESQSTPDEKAAWIHQVQYTMSGFRHDEKRTVKLTQTGTVYVEGNYKTPAVLKITSTASTVKVLGITVQSAAGVVVIDGLKKTVTKDSKNKFSDTDLTRFPELLPGMNTVDIDGASEVEISYYPIYL